MSCVSIQKKLIGGAAVRSLYENMADLTLLFFLVTEN